MSYPSKQKIKKPTVLRIYWRLCTHLEHTRTHTCTHCYTRGNSLIIQGDVTAHIKGICDDMKQHDFSSIVDDLQDSELVECTHLRDNLYELKLLQQQKKEGKIA